MQDRSRVASISIPALDASTRCPVSALSSMLQVQTVPDDPTFSDNKAWIDPSQRLCGQETS